jgi:hypothetical protein
VLVFGEPESSWVELVRRGPFEADIDADVFFYAGRIQNVYYILFSTCITLYHLVFDYVLPTASMKYIQMLISVSRLGNKLKDMYTLIRKKYKCGSLLHRSTTLPVLGLALLLFSW